MPIDDPTDVAQPMSDEMRAGGSYIDYQPEPFKLDLAPEPQAAPAQPSRVQQPAAPNIMEMSRKVREGRAREVNDLSLTISGIADGDPVGMETFDLGFFEDGTPAVVINGANVPIRHEQWMALMNMREKTRADIDAKTQFAIAQQDAMTAVAQVEASMALPSGMAPLLYAQARNNPDAALQNLSNLYLSMQKSGGRDMMSTIARDIQDNENKNAIDYLLRPQGEQEITRPNPFNPTLAPITERVKQPSRRDAEAQRLLRSSAPHDQITANAWLRLEDMVLDPAIRVGNPTGSIGIFDRIARETDRTGPMSLLSRLQHLAAYHNGAWPDQTTIPIESPPAMGMGFGGVPITTAQDSQRYMDYLMRLDRFAAGAFRYQASSLESLQAIANEMAVINAQRAGMGQQQQQQPQQTTITNTPASAAPTRLTPSATGGTSR